MAERTRDGRSEDQIAFDVVQDIEGEDLKNDR